VVQHRDVFVMADDHSRDRVVGAPLWPHRPLSVVRLSPHVLLNSLDSLPRTFTCSIRPLSGLSCSRTNMMARDGSAWQSAWKEARDCGKAMSYRARLDSGRVDTN
jgi:hypothetical protein